MHQLTVSKDRTAFDLGDDGQLQLTLTAPQALPTNSLWLSFSAGAWQGLGVTLPVAKDSHYLTWHLPETLDALTLARYLHQQAPKVTTNVSGAVPANLASYWQQRLTDLTSLLTGLGVTFTTTAAKPKGKPRHRFVKALQNQPLTVNYNGAQATVYWRKANQFEIEAGAHLVPEAPLNKDGQLGFAARFALQLRQEHAEAIVDSRLVAPVTLKSINEVGHFLYFAGTNSWLQLITPDGHTLHELTVVS